MVKSDFLKKPDDRKKIVRLSFFLFLMILLVQFLFSLTFTEPYPALLLPSFSSVPDDRGRVSYHISEITAFSGNLEIGIPSEHELLNTMPPVYSSIISRKLFSESSFLINPEPDTSFREFQFGSLLVKVNRRTIQPEQKKCEVQHYLQERLINLTGREIVDSLLFVFHEIHWNMETKAEDTVGSREYKIIFDE